MKHDRTEARSQRQLRIGELIRHALSKLLERREVRDPGLDGVSVTITEVRISPDIKNATVFVMPLGGGETDRVLASLKRAAPFVRRRLSKSLSLRRLPALSFELDKSFDNANRIEELLKSSGVAADIDSEGNFCSVEDG
jgi:ribosome-binding factor A